MTGPPTVGVLGTGYWGRNLLRNFSALEALGAFADVRADVLDELREIYPDAVACVDANSLLDQPVDAIVIATPAETHADHVARCLDAGKHVFVEKPLALDVDVAVQLRDKAAANGLVLMVGHLMLYHPAFHALAHLVATGELGTIRYLYSNRLSLGKIRREENALWSFAPHDVSMILALVGRLPDSVVATGGHYLAAGVADTTLSHLDFGSELQAHIFVSWLHPFKDQRLVVVGESAMAVFNDVLPSAEKLQLFRHEVAWDGDVPLVTEARSEPIAVDDVEPLAEECRSFLDAIQNRGEPPSDADEAIRVLAVLDACQRSLSSGRPEGLVIDG